MSNTSAKYHTESERKIGMVLWQHALSQDLGEVTVLQICQEAGVSRATFYRHFSGPKQALCDVIEDYQSDLLRGRCEGGFPEFVDGILYLTDPDEPLRRYMEMLFDPDMEKRLVKTLEEEMRHRGFFDPVMSGRNYRKVEKNILTDTFCRAVVSTLKAWAGGEIGREEARKFLLLLYERIVRSGPE